jgi:hypothetical protein
MVEKFKERAEDMGLDSTFDYKGMWKYEDSFGEVVYRTLGPQNVSNDQAPHPTDDKVTGMLGIYTKAPDSENYSYCGYVSHIYKFIGNQQLISSIKESIESFGEPIMRENYITSYDLTSLRGEVVISNPKSYGGVGDIYPVIIIKNSYNGNAAASMGFGIGFQTQGNHVVFSFRLGEIRMVHIAHSKTRISGAFQSYMQAYNEGIIELITNSFENRLEPREMLAVLDVVESAGGKKRRNEISELLSEIQQGSENPTCWQLFLAIVRYSSMEPNLNVKRLLENAAESVLVIPPRMHDVLTELQRRT